MLSRKNVIFTYSIQPLMYLSQLRLYNFKNYAQAELKFDEKVNIIFGDNGSGKTNLLDAIHFLSVSKSYFGLSDKYLIKEEEPFYRLEANASHDDRTDRIAIKYKRDQKRDISVNEKKLSKVNDLIGRMPVVLVAPDDINIVKGGSKERRDYFNKWLCQSDPNYLTALMSYNRLLRQKDALLKSDTRPSHLVIASFNHQMAAFAKTIHESILEAIATFSVEMKEQYRRISDGKDQIEINYLSDLTGQDIEALFDQKISEEIAVRRPLVGVQRDDYEFLIEGRPFKKYGSQGQIKSLLYSLRLAEFGYIKKRLDRTPILILDDFFEKLDQRRLAALMTLINEPSFGQVFLSDTELERSKTIFDERGIKFGAYHVVEGTVTRLPSSE